MIAQKVAVGLLKTGMSPQAAGKAAGATLAKFTVWLALVGPVFNIMNYTADSMLSDAARTLTVFVTISRRAADPNTVTIQHPTWGQVTVRLTGEPDPTATTPYGVQIVDPSGRILWERNEYDIGAYGWELNTPATDNTGNVFIKYNPGRLDGIIVLRPVPSGMDDLGTAEPQDDYLKRFYGAEAVDVNGDGNLEIRHSVNDCDPTCAGGTTTVTIYQWDGIGYSN